jgi:DNA gyrase subunit A
MAKKVTSNQKKEEINKAGKIEPCDLSQEMKGSYLDYAMSVIVSRALPNVCDGLKPVHRRILYAMWNMGLKPGARFRKSANVVGEIIGKYHPHGDAAAYDSLVRMTQDFSLRYPLVAGQGNFGSLDGDSAAAYRYTESKLSPISEEMLFDIEKETVDFVPNYDGTQQEPKVLPAKLPNLLLNGSMGIAVGMATNIPPHNLGELCEAITHLIDHPKATIDDLIQYVKGPDFPTGGLIFDPGDIKQIYASGRGSVVVRARTEIIEESLGHFKIIISEIPYQVNKATLLEKIANLVKEKKIEGIKDLRDETDRTSRERGLVGVRIVIDLKSGAFPQKVLNRLFKLTQLQDSFHVNTVALVDDIQPRLLNLKSIFEEYIKHRSQVIKRRTEFDLKRAKDRAHILEGLKIALKKIDLVIKTIKKSKDREEAKKRLIKRFKLSERQAIAILEMKLQQLARLEAKKIQDELREKLELIKELKKILKDPKKILKIIKKELAELKDKFADDRRTQIIPRAAKVFAQEDLIPDEPAVVMITRDGYIKRLPPSSFRLQHRGGKGVIGLTTREEDSLATLITTTTHSDLLFFTTKGRVFQLKAYEIPETSRTSKGQALVNFLQISPREKVTALVSLKELKNYQYLVMTTRDGVIKKVDIKSFASVRRSGLIAIKLKGDDELKWVRPSIGKDEIILVSALGQAVRFKEKDVRAMGRAAAGVKGMRLKKNDQIVEMGVTGLAKSQKLLVVSENGFGKMSELKNYRLQRRGGSGIKTAKVTEKTGQIISAMLIDPKSLPEIVKGDLIVISSRGQVIRLPLKAIPTLGRATQGVRLMRFKESKDKVASVTLV